MWSYGLAAGKTTASRCTSSFDRRSPLAAAALVVWLAVGGAAHADVGPAQVPPPGQVSLAPQIAGRQARLLQAAVAAGQLGIVENHAPGPVSANDRVTLALAEDGTVGPLVVEERVAVTGTGDYVLEIPAGGAAAVALPGSDNRPGLRDGTVLWEGFSAGREDLAARVTLRPSERDRFPVTVRTSAAGSDIVLDLANATELAVDLPVAAVDPSALSAVRSALVSVLEQGREPVVGADGIPALLPAAGPVGRQRRSIAVPVRIRGTVSFAGVSRPVDVTLGSAAAPNGRLRLVGRPPVVPKLEVALVRPTIDDLVAGDVSEVVGFMARVARAADYRPLVPGFVRADTAVSFAIVSGGPPTATSPMAEGGDMSGPKAVLASAAIGLALLAAVAVWSRS